MYEDLYELVEKQTRQDKFQIQLFLNNTNDGDSMKILAKKVGAVIPALRAIDKHRTKKTQTDRWWKKRLELQDKADKAVSMFMVILSDAHQEVNFFIRMLYIISKEEVGEKITLEESNNIMFADLLRGINILDSTDRERYRLFNNFRNVIFHTPYEHLLHSLNNENMSDLIDLFDSLSETNISLGKHYEDRIDKILIEGVKSNFEASEYKFSEDMKSITFATNISV